mmetsp:Transcript_19994/g.57287  ORF Transcript_19994/g.57287 Transcript_19994/m.57287 type:complete len:236 (+) Transcript_19994:256-963(+)
MSSGDRVDGAAADGIAVAVHRLLHGEQSHLGCLAASGGTDGRAENGDEGVVKRRQQVQLQCTPIAILHRDDGRTALDRHVRRSRQHLVKKAILQATIDVLAHRLIELHAAASQVVVDDRAGNEGARRRISHRPLIVCCPPRMALALALILANVEHIAPDGRVVTFAVLLEGVLLQGVHSVGGEGRVESDGEVGRVADCPDLVGGRVVEQLEGVVADVRVRLGALRWYLVACSGWE